MATKRYRLPHLAGKGNVSPKGADMDSSFIAVDVPAAKETPEPEDFTLIGSIGLRYATYEPRFRGQMEGFGNFGGNNFLIQLGLNFRGNMGRRAS